MNVYCNVFSGSYVFCDAPGSLPHQGGLFQPPSERWHQRVDDTRLSRAPRTNQQHPEVVTRMSARWPNRLQFSYYCVHLVNETVSTNYMYTVFKKHCYFGEILSNDEVQHTPRIESSNNKCEFVFCTIVMPHKKYSFKISLSNFALCPVIIFGLRFAFFTHISGEKRTVSKYVR